MITGRRSTDWLRDASAPAAENGRRGPDRRAADRRAPRRRFDPLFMATLVDQVAQPEAATGAYPAPPALRRGVIVNLRT